MGLRLLVLISISSIFIFSGILWLRKSLSSADSYDFKEDVKHTFLTPHWTYSNHFNDGKPRRIAPVIAILIGMGILVVGLIKVLWI
jgi:hypothetical protein